MFKTLISVASLLVGALTVLPAFADADSEALVKKIGTDVIDAAKADKSIQAGDVNRVITLVDAKVLHMSTSRP